MTRFPSALLAATILIAACTPTTVDAPSLLPRANEKLSFDEPDAPPLAAVVPDPALDAAIGGAAKALTAAADRFAGDATRAEALIDAARGAAPGSDSWLDAQVALAGLDDDRATSLAILSDLDQRAADHGITGAPAYPALERLRARAQAQVAAQTARIAALSARLPTG
ncbi:hypothetical protein DFR49_1344 [Hephaestia caeni]|uniref:DUF4142 domain-containing protein n=1 Tax=Hephaestia caeni TaxID=645617 RepID=A0A397PHP3_9SPHN|nr:hypothetical protein [Hephaestia caeni]RIA46785.1 hypothetical protein DFR49_1344 [Hephaestia caeni]